MEFYSMKIRTVLVCLYLLPAACGKESSTSIPEHSDTSEKTHAAEALLINGYSQAKEITMLLQPKDPVKEVVSHE